MTHASRVIPRVIQRALIARDGMVCRWCGTPVVRSNSHRPDRLHFDHVLAWGSGGEHTVANLVVACAACNLSRRKPRNSVRNESIVRLSYGAYRWTDPGYVPPLALDPTRTSYGLYQCAHDRTDRRSTLAKLLSEIRLGLLPASGLDGPIYVQPPLPATPYKPHIRRARRPM